MIYQDHNGSHQISGIADIFRLQGISPSYAPRIVTDEDGVLVGLAGGSISLQKSMPVIAALREQALLKSQKAGKPLLARKVINKPSILKKSFAPCLFNKLLDDLNKIKLMRA